MNGIRLVALGLGMLLLGCGAGTPETIHVRVRNECDRPATLWAFVAETNAPNNPEWGSVGVVKPHTDGDFDLPLARLGPDKNIRLQPGAGPVQMTELSSKTIPGGGCKGTRKATLTMKKDETMEVAFE